MAESRAPTPPEQDKNTAPSHQPARWRDRLHRPMVVLFACFAMATLASAVACVFSYSASYAVTGFAACTVVTVPLLHPRYTVLSPWSLFALIIYDACGLRQLAVATGWNDPVTSNDVLFLLGHGPEYFWWPSVLYVCGLALAATAFLWTLDRGGVRRRRPLPPSALSSRRPGRRLIDRALHATHPLRDGLIRYEFRKQAPYGIAILALVGFCGFVLYAQATGGVDLTSLTAKRSYNSGVQVSTGYSSHGFARLLGSFAVVAFWLHLVFILRGRTVSWRSPGPWVAIVLLGNAALLPVYNSQRTDIGVILLVALAIFFALRQDSRQRWRVARGFAIAAIVVFAAMTIGRLQSQNSSSASLSPSHVMTSVGEVVIWNRNHGDMFTASHIVHAVPDRLPYAHGDTITSWFAAPVPRSLWASKPRISPGPVIGEVIYGNGRSGVPPGLVGEMYWNFGILGVLIGAALVGLALGLLTRWVLPNVARSAATVALICALVVPFGLYVLEEGVGGALFQVVFTAVPLLVGLTVCGPWRHPRDTAGVVYPDRVADPEV